MDPQVVDWYHAGDSTDINWVGEFNLGKGASLKEGFSQMQDCIKWFVEITLHPQFEFVSFTVRPV